MNQEMLQGGRSDDPELGSVVRESERQGGKERVRDISEVNC